MQLLSQERTLVGPSEFAKLVKTNVPADLAEEFAAALRD